MTRSGTAEVSLASSAVAFIFTLLTNYVQDIAGAVLFLTSRAGAFVNGMVLVSDGGQLSVEPGSY